MTNDLTNKPPASPKGRATQARQGFTADYFSALQAAFAEHGVKAIETCAKEEPTKFLAICSQHIPRDVSVALEHTSGGLGPIEIEILKGIREALPGANDMQPGEALALVRVRFYTARPVEEQAK
jgi:hypothetical protein